MHASRRVPDLPSVAQQMNTGEQVKAPARNVLLPGLATHFRPEGCRHTACGMCGTFHTSALAREVDCLRCRKTKLFKAYAY